MVGDQPGLAALVRYMSLAGWSRIKKCVPAGDLIYDSRIQGLGAMAIVWYIPVSGWRTGCFLDPIRRKVGCLEPPAIALNRITWEREMKRLVILRSNKRYSKFPTQGS